MAAVWFWDSDSSSWMRQRDHFYVLSCDMTHAVPAESVYWCSGSICIIITCTKNYSAHVAGWFHIHKYSLFRCTCPSVNFFTCFCLMVVVYSILSSWVLILTQAWVFVMISGQMWNNIRGPPFAHKDPQTGATVSEFSFFVYVVYHIVL